MGIETPNWRITGASVAGTAHAKSHRKCEDAHRLLEFSDGSVLVAVADGAGSAARGGEGARIAVEAAADFWVTHDRTRDLRADTDIVSFLSNSLAAARRALEKVADRRALLLRDFATTLIVLIATPDRVAAAQIGDGASIVRETDGSLAALTNPGSDGYVNETTFLTSDDALSTAQLSIRSGDAAGFAVFTDGLQLLALQMPDGTPHQPFFTPLFQFAARESDEGQAQRELIEFLRSPRITQRTDDDLTIVLGTRIA